MKRRITLVAVAGLAAMTMGMGCPLFDQLVEQLDCPNPAATDITFSVVSRTGEFTGVVRVTGTVQNIGLQDFDSSAGQQSIRLLQDGIEVASGEFTDLSAGESTSISFTRAWDASSPAEGEFPPTYRVTISYDPDITLDGNPNNDDCRTSDNTREESGSQINALF